jgi:hypothetical protein
MQFVNSLLGNGLSDQYNSNGHRCKEISEINFQNYILFAGDNGSLGLDKPVEQTFPYLISQKLKCDYYNLSVFNGGLDALRYNLITWFTKYKRPKAVVISVEFMNSLLISDANFTKIDAADYNDEIIQDVSNVGNICGFFAGRNILARELLKQYVICPIYQLRYANSVQLFDSDFVTDIDYDGDQFDYNNIAQVISAKIIAKTQRVRP